MRSTFTLIRPAALAPWFADAVLQLRDLPLELDTRALPLVEARLLCGDFEPVARLIAHARPHPALPLMAARHHDWSGDLHTLTNVFPAVRASLDLLHDCAQLRARTFYALQRAATDVGDATLAAHLAHLARLEPPPPIAAHDSLAHRVLETARVLIDPEPDAFRGRITLRPRLRDEEAIELRDLRFSDGAISLYAERELGSIRYRIEQEAGATPFTALLEPMVESVSEAEVDGRTARLDVRPVDGGVIAPIQLVLDHLRTVVLR